MEINSNFSKDFGSMKKHREDELCNLLSNDECLISKWCYLNDTGECVKLSQDIECFKLNKSPNDCMRMSKCKWIQNENNKSDE